MYMLTQFISSERNHGILEDLGVIITNDLEPSRQMSKATVSANSIHTVTLAEDHDLPGLRDIAYSVHVFGQTTP